MDYVHCTPCQLVLELAPLQLFCEVAQASPTVVACRLSPIQKSELVRMIKDAHKKNVTAAIGDGGNDVSMIQGRTAAGSDLEDINFVGNMFMDLRQSRVIS